jgi:LysM domain
VKKRSEPMRSRSPVVGMLLWLGAVAALAAAVTTLHILGRERVPTPPLRSLDDLRAWANQHDGTVVPLAILRLAGLALGWYLLVITAANGAIRAAGNTGPPLRRIVERATPASLRRLFEGAAGAGMVSLVAIGAVAPSPNPTPSSSPQSTMVLHRLPDEARPSPVVPSSGPTTVTTPRITPIAPPQPSVTTTSAPTSGAERAPPPAVVDDTRVIEAGESFWSVARDQVAEALRANADDAEVRSYWLRLIEANRSILVDPSNPDLLFVGQTLTLPPV